MKNPTYEEVCSGTHRARGGRAGHLRPEGDFVRRSCWRCSGGRTTRPRRTGRATTAGPQYRSAIFYHSERQKQLAERYKQKIDDGGRVPLAGGDRDHAVQAFYPADEDHQNFYANNPRQGYCCAVIGPKLEKLKKVFAEKLKNGVTGVGGSVGFVA